MPVETLFFPFQSLTNRGQRSHSVEDSGLFCFYSPVVITMCSPDPLLRVLRGVSHMCSHKPA